MNISTIDNCLEYYADKQPDKTAYTFLRDDGGVDNISYGELYQRVCTLAMRFQEDAHFGDRAILLYPSGLEFISAFLACLRAGIVAVPSYPPRRNRSSRRLSTIFYDAQPKLVLTTKKIEPSVQSHIAQGLETCSCLATDMVSTDPNAVDSSHFSQGESVAYLQYTSGSTGTPKGVVVTHGNLMHNERAIQAAFGHTSNSVHVGWLPLFHDMGLVGNVLQPLFVGYFSVLMSPNFFLAKPRRWLEAISKYRGTSSGGPNFAFDHCVRNIGEEDKAGLDLSCWEVAFNGAEPVRAGTLERFSRAFESCGFRYRAFYPCYGLAESTLFVSGPQPQSGPVVETVRGQLMEDTVNRKTASKMNGLKQIVGCGQVWENTRAIIVDPESRFPQPPGDEGEIWIASPSVAQGYWRRPEESREIFAACLANSLDNHNEESFLRTGDLGFMKAGQLFVTGRLKDLIIIRGRNHYPQDIENTVEQAVDFVQSNSCAAITITVGEEDRLVLAVEASRELVRKISIVRKQHATPNQQDHETAARVREDLDLTVGRIVTIMREAVAVEHEVSLYAVTFVNPGSFPRTSSGKVQRHACRSLFLEQKDSTLFSWYEHDEAGEAVERKSSSTDDAAVCDDCCHPSLEETRQLIHDCIVTSLKRDGHLGVDHIDYDRSFTSFGFDSLGFVAIGLALEKATGRKMDPDLIYEFNTVNKLATQIGNIEKKATDNFRKGVQGPVLGKERILRLNQRYQEISERGDYFFQPIIEDLDGAWVIIAGRRMLMLASYSYLGLIGHPKIDGAAFDAIQKFGTGTHGARLLAGTVSLHRELEATIARFKKTEDAVVFSSGYITNLTVISTFLEQGHVVICDILNHASIVDGCHFSGAEILFFRHNDMMDLERCLKHTGNAGKLVVTDAVFSMDGDIINLPELVRLSRAYGAHVMVDEAHSLGILGATGRGIVEHFSMESDAIDIHMGTLSKTVPSIGGYIAGPKEIIHSLKHNARGFIFSAALPPPQVAAAKAAFDVILGEPERVQILQAKVKHYIASLRKLGFNTLNSETAIVPIICDSEEQAFEMVRHCQTGGVFVLPVVYPAVPKESPRLRTTITYAHTDADIGFALKVFEQAGRVCGLIS